MCLNKEAAFGTDYNFVRWRSIVILFAYIWLEHKHIFIIFKTEKLMEYLSVSEYEWY